MEEEYNKIIPRSYLETHIQRLKDEESRKKVSRTLGKLGEGWLGKIKLILTSASCLQSMQIFIFDFYSQWGLRLERWPNRAARLAGWRRVTQQGVILYVIYGPCLLPWRTAPLAPVWGWSFTKCTHTVHMRYVTRERHGLVPSWPMPFLWLWP